MDDLLESVLRVGVLMVVVGPALAWIGRAAAKERKRATSSRKRFCVETPMTVRIVFAGCGVLFEAMLLFVYVWQGVAMGIWDHQLMWLGHALALACFVVWGWRACSAWMSMETSCGIAPSRAVGAQRRLPMSPRPRCIFRCIA